MISLQNCPFCSRDYVTVFSESKLGPTTISCADCGRSSTAARGAAREVILEKWQNKMNIDDQIIPDLTVPEVASLPVTWASVLNRTVPRVGRKVR